VDLSRQVLLSARSSQLVEQIFVGTVELSLSVSVGPLRTVNSRVNGFERLEDKLVAGHLLVLLQLFGPQLFFSLLGVFLVFAAVAVDSQSLAQLLTFQLGVFSIRLVAHVIARHRNRIFLFGS